LWGKCTLVTHDLTMFILFVHNVFSLLFLFNFLSIRLRENEKQKINVEKSILMSETVGVAIRRSQRNKTLFPVEQQQQ